MDRVDNHMPLAGECNYLHKGRSRSPTAPQGHPRSASRRCSIMSLTSSASCKWRVPTGAQAPAIVRAREAELR